MANRYPLTLDTSDGQLKELPNGDNLNLTGNSIVGVSDVTAQGTIAATTINVTTLNIDSTPIADVAKSGDYNDLINRPLNLSDFTNDENFISNGDNISLLTNDANYLTSVSWLQITNKPATVAELGLVDSVSTSTPISIFTNDIGYLTEDQVEGLEALTGNYKGSVFGDDSTILVDGVLNSINLNGTIRSDVIPFADSVYSLGSPANEFLNIYANVINGDLQGSVFSDDSSVTMVDAINNELAANRVIITDGNVDASIDFIYPGVPSTGELLGSIQTFDQNGLTHSIRFTEQKIGMFKDLATLAGTHLFDNRYVIAGLPVKINSTDPNDYVDLPSDALEVVGDVKANTFKGDLIGSVFAEDSSPIVDATNGSLYYAATTPADWNGTAPTTVGEAIDRLATLVKTLNGGTGA